MDEENNLIWINSKSLQIHIHMYVCVCVCIHHGCMCLSGYMCVCLCVYMFLKASVREFPGSPVVKTQHGFNPWLGN